MRGERERERAATAVHGVSRQNITFLASGLLKSWDTNIIVKIGEVQIGSQVLKQGRYMYYMHNVQDA